MEFLLIWVLGGDVIDSGLRYKSAAKCFSESQNAATEMRDVGLTSPQFTCIPVAKGKDFKIYRKDSNNSRFPFWLDSLISLIKINKKLKLSDFIIFVRINFIYHFFI